MKAATGELQLTVITMIAIAAVIGFFWAMWPKIQEAIGGQWEDISTVPENANNGMIIKDYTFGNYKIDF